MGNQWKPIPPIDWLQPLIELYWNQGKGDKEILRILLEYHIDTEEYGLGITKFRAIRKSLGFTGTRQQGHTAESLGQVIPGIRALFPKAGVRDMKSLLQDREGVRASRSAITEYFNTMEPELKQQRIGKNLRRRQFWAAGVNVIWSMDQHDKWKYKYGLCLHVAVDVFSGYLLWLKVWWNNSNPMLICKYYLDTVESLGYVPLLTQSDPGTENTRVANAQSFLRQMHDPNLAAADGVQHAWKRDKSNIKAEIEWSQLRRRWSSGFEDILEAGAELARFDRNNPLQVLLFRYLFIPWIQMELDQHRRRVNNFAKRANVHKLTPVGVPVDLHFRPHEKGARDFKINLANGAVAAARQEYIDGNHRVFQMVPLTFNEVADAIWSGLGGPLINHSNVWLLYSDMLEQIEVSVQLGAIPMDVVRQWRDFVEGVTTEGDRALVEAEEMDRGANYAEDDAAPYGFQVTGDGVEGGGLFTDDEGGDDNPGDDQDYNDEVW